MAAPKKTPLKRTAEQETRALKLAEERKAKSALAVADTKAKAEQAQLAQIINLMISGMTLEEIGSQIGMTAGDLDALITRNGQRYIRTQPQLRIYVRNWVSDRYTQLLDANWDEATSKTSPHKLENQDRAIRILDSMRKLHGADAPTQTEVVVDSAPEAVERLVQAMAAQQGLDYDVDIFDVVDAEVVHEAVTETHAALEQAYDDIETVSGNEENL